MKSIREEIEDPKQGRLPALRCDQSLVDMINSIVEFENQKPGRRIRQADVIRVLLASAASEYVIQNRVSVTSKRQS